MKKYEVSEEFIKAGHAAACSDWKKKIEDQFPEVFKVYAKLGARFSDFRGTEYMLAQVGIYSACLIDMTEGNRLKEPIQISNPKNITEAELIQMGATGFAKLSR